MDHDADGFFVLRTPLLPVETLTGWSGSLTAAPDAGDLDARLAEDRAALTTRLSEIFERADVTDALYVASPKLARRARAEALDPKMARTLVKYLIRMSTRPTPFGLFAGISVGSIEAATEMAIGARDTWRRATQLDMQFLSALADEVANDGAARAHLTYSPNSSLYRSGDRLRYAEAGVRNGRRVYRLVAIDASDAVLAVLQQAAGGARLEELAATLVDEDVDRDRAVGFVESLIDAQALVPGLGPPVTGPRPLEDTIDQLRAIPAAAKVVHTLEEGRAALEKIDAGGVGAEPGQYEDALEPLLPLTTDADIGRMLLVDLVKPAQAVRLGRAIVDEVARATEVLRSMMGSAGPTPLDGWRERFVSRYGDRDVALAEALDEEAGIGFQASTSPSADASPLLAGLPWPPGVVEESWGPRAGYLLRRVAETAERGEIELRLSPDDVDKLRATAQRPAPDALAALVAVTMDPARASSFTVRVLGVSGPSGARLMGRVCHASEALTDAVKAHLRREEVLRPDAVFAEIVHLPEGRTGNLLARPVLRAGEIVFLGRSGARPEDRLTIADLAVSVRGERVVLSSTKDGREVIPRLTSAQNYTRRSLGIYRFLAALQGQGCLDGIVWSWGALEAAPFLPRLTNGKTVFARARWALSADELRAFTGASSDGPRYRALQELRQEKRLPRWVAVADADNELALDLDNVMCADVLADLARERAYLVLVELWPSPEESPVTAPDGRYANELLIPFVRRAPATPQPRRQTVPSSFRHTFPPGSEWLYVKLHVGQAAADLVVRDVVGPLVRSLHTEGHIDRWFFIRYGDPDWHVRVRLHGDPGPLLESALPSVLEAANTSELVTRVQLDTYEREAARYGGPEGVELAEEMWRADSDAVVSLLGGPPYDLDVRWRVGLAGIDMLFDDFGLGLAAKAALARRLRDGYMSERRGDAALKKALGERFRDRRAGLDALLDPARKIEAITGLGAAALLQRSEALAEPCARLRALETSGELWAPLSEVAASHAHMFANRLFRSHGRAHELAIYDHLDRLYVSLAARAEKLLDKED